MPKLPITQLGSSQKVFIMYKMYFAVILSGYDQ